MKVKSFSDHVEKASAGSVTLNEFLLLSSRSGTSQLTQKQIIKNFHKSPPLNMAVSAISRAVSQVDYSFDSNSPQFDINKPNKYHSGMDFFSLITRYLKLVGEVFLIKGSGIEGKALIPVPPFMMEKLDDDTWEINETLFNKNKFNEDELVIIREPSLLDPYDEGRAEGNTLSSELDIHEQGSDYVANYFENNARPDALVTVSGASEDELKSFKESIKNKHRGPKNSGKMAAFKDADINVETLSQEFGKLGVDDIRAYSAKVIRTLYGIPESVVGLSSGISREGAETDNYIFKKNVVQPIVKKIVQSMNNQYFQKELGITLEHDDIIPINKKHAIELVKTDPTLLTREEKRQLIGFEGDINNEE